MNEIWKHVINITSDKITGPLSLQPVEEFQATSLVEQEVEVLTLEATAEGTAGLGAVQILPHHQQPPAWQRDVDADQTSCGAEVASDPPCQQLPDPNFEGTVANGEGTEPPSVAAGAPAAVSNVEHAARSSEENRAQAPQVLGLIGSEIGKLLYIDKLTRTRERLAYAHLLIEVSVIGEKIKTVPTKVQLDLEIVYESMPDFCEECRSVSSPKSPTEPQQGPHMENSGQSAAGSSGTAQNQQANQSEQSEGSSLRSVTLGTKDMVSINMESSSSVGIEQGQEASSSEASLPMQSDNRHGRQSRDKSTSKGINNCTLVKTKASIGALSADSGTKVDMLPIAGALSVHGIGVCYGRDGNNLPSPSDVVALYRSNGISNMRIYSPAQDALQALSGSNIQLIVGVPNDNVQSIASDPSAAASWVQSNIVAFPGVAFSYVAVGNELIPENLGLAQFVLPAMQNIQNAINAAGLQSSIRVSTAVSAAVLSQASPPSQGAFGPDSMRAIVQFLDSNGAPLLFNVYPYISYRDNTAQILLDYALFRSSGVVVQDGQFGYQNLFDAIVDAAYAALEKVGGSNVRIVVSESGWPSAGGFAASTDNARTYNQNLIRHVGQGTPRRSGNAIETYIFAMFNENQKRGDEIERNFGLFRPDRQPVYPISFN
ncbi:hypothetical protein ZIOFF_033175 [Zingiber officinale]|uniref:Glucan endo-1,3-beta-D-glucosidase n=1 Tax=Zingiber officinale TaxID=94328 RepID=A0A8J5GJI6_ZINOF|nr:hypothetical protein ZIOFF_033175 [Zingiber officinale]